MDMEISDNKKKVLGYELYRSHISGREFFFVGLNDDEETINRKTEEMLSADPLKVITTEGILKYTGEERKKIICSVMDVRGAPPLPIITSAMDKTRDPAIYRELVDAIIMASSRKENEVTLVPDDEWDYRSDRSNLIRIDPICPSAEESDGN